jgi:hypothetical protein
MELVVRRVSRSDGITKRSLLRTKHQELGFMFSHTSLVVLQLDQLLRLGGQRVVLLLD